MKALQLFLILLFALIFCGCLGKFMREGMENNGDSDHESDHEDNEYKEDAKRDHEKDIHTLTGPAGQHIEATHKNTVQGVSRTDIPPGQEDLYILKSEVIPPVCPACPTVSECPRQKPCPPCPPCARCPEPAFECKKVPNYITSDDRYLPRPVLSDFSQFGT